MIPIVHEISYRDPEKILLCLANEPGLCFLDSSKFNENFGRYSYLCIDPFLIIKSKNNAVEINEDLFHGNPFDFLNDQLKRYNSFNVDDLPPFQGGAMGYWGYDLLHHLENIPRPPIDDIHFPDMVLGFYDCVIACDHVKQKIWIISQGFPETDEFKRKKRAKDRASELLNKIESNVPIAKINCWGFLEKIKIHSNFTQSNYHQAIKKVISYICAGDIFQANISQRFSGNMPKDIRPIDLYTALRGKNPAPFSAFLHFDDVFIASASPERFIRMHNRHVETRPIKGTRARGKTQEVDEFLANDLINSEKDCAENIMIVDLMRNDLSRVCEPDSINVTKLCGLESYETVHHLVSVVEGKLASGQDAVSLLKATFPGGSITGAPKIRAMEIIHEIEPCARGVYCGSIGYIGFDGNMDTSIVIRTYVIRENQVYFQAGGGILADSDPESEYQETLTKADALRRVLQGEGENA